MRSHSFTIVVAAVFLFAACQGQETAAPDTAPETAIPAAGDFMKDAEGSWEGINTLWLQYPNDPQESAATAVVSPGRVEYTWSYKGDPQTGTFEFSGGGERLDAQWTDSWHSKEAMACGGAERDGVVKVTGTYAAGEGPDWSWRTEFRLDAPDKLNIKMYNILPDGLMPEREERELLAVDMNLKRVD